MSYFNTNSANAPGPNDPTYNGAPFADEAALLSGAGVAASASRGLVGGITAFARQAGDEALALARAGAQQVSRVYQAASNTALNRSQRVAAHVMTNPIYIRAAQNANRIFTLEAANSFRVGITSGQGPIPTGGLGVRDLLPPNPYVPDFWQGSGAMINRGMNVIQNTNFSSPPKSSLSGGFK